MKRSIQNSFFCLLAMILLAAPVTHAFAPCQSMISTKSHNFIQAQLTFQTQTSALDAYKKKEPVEAPEEGKEKTPPLTLLITYMTPWRNPNSIFVYMFAAVYILGKYSEAATN